MQRAAASPASDSAPPTSVSAAPQGPLAKRQKTSHVKEVITPADVKAVQAAVAAEEAKRAEAIERQAAEIGETRWALSFMEDQAAHETPMAVVTAGYASLDSAVLSAPSPRENRNGVSRSEKVGRISYGNYKSRREVCTISRTAAILLEQTTDVDGESLTVDSGNRTLLPLQSRHQTQIKKMKMIQAESMP